MRIIKVGMVLTLVVVLLLTVGCGKVEQKNEAPTNQVVLEKDKPAPDFTLKDLNGKDVKLSDYKGKYVLINFWATWCGFCEKEIPDLIAFGKANDDVVILAVNYMESGDVVQTYFDKKAFELNTLLDTDGNIGALYAVSAFPTTYAVDKQGNLVWMYKGMLTREELDKLKSYLKENYPK